MDKKLSVLIKEKIGKFNKTIKIPADKSCSIRALLIASQCMGVSNIKNLHIQSEDVLDCFRILTKKLGVKIVKSHDGIYKVYGNGLNSFRIKNKLTRIFVGNSLTTCRLLCGLLATYPNKFYLYGDASANRRDMSRVIEPLEKIGASFSPKGTTTMPLTIEGTSMPLAQNHIENRGSGQIKGMLLLNALSVMGETTIEERKISRSHTEKFLQKISADIKIKKLKNKKGNLISLKGQKNLFAFDYTVGSDPSSAAFFIALTLLTPGSKLIMHNVLCDPTRRGFVKVLKEKMNANIKIKKLRRSSSNNELMGTIVVKSSSLKPLSLPKKLIGSLIDEMPILVVIASLTNGISKLQNINEATKKESNRIQETHKILAQAGIKCKSTKDSMIIYGKEKMNFKNKSIVCRTHGDHRISMSACIFSLVTGIKTKINNFETINTSFPEFSSLIKRLGGKIVESK